MQEHFNENYVESEKYPKAIFKGKIEDEVDFTKAGTYNVTITGTMSLHGVEKQVTTKGILIIEKGGLKLSTKFDMVPEEYNIPIPGAVRDKIAEKMEVTVKSAYKPV